MEKDIKEIEKATQDLLGKLDFAKVKVKAQRTPEQMIEVTLEVPLQDSGMLIGFHGETLYALQHILSLTLFKKLGGWQPLLLNIGDYRQKREEQLSAMATDAANQVRATQRPVTLPFLTSSERRTIHLLLADDPDVSTQSEGEGRDRRITVVPKVSTKNTEN